MRSILILDDELPSAKMIEKLLSKNFPSIEVISKLSSVEMAVAYLKENHADLVFLDLKLNGESGFDLLDKINPRTFDFICLSASQEFAFKAFEYNASGYLLKPVNSAELITAVTKWLNMHKQNIENT